MTVNRGSSVEGTANGTEDLPPRQPTLSLAALLGVASEDQAEDQAALVSARWDVGRLFVDLVFGDKSEQTLFIEAAVEGTQGFAQSETLSISYTGSTLDPEFADYLKQVMESLGGADLGALEESYPRDWTPSSADGETSGPRFKRPGRPLLPETNVQRLPELLGLASPDGDFSTPQIVGAEWWGAELVIELDGPDFHPFAVVLEPKREGRTGYCSSEHMLFCYEGETIDEDQGRVVLDLAQKNPDLTLEDLREAFTYVPRVIQQVGKDYTDDEGLSVCGATPADPGVGDDGVTRAWRGKRQWYRFVCSKEISRNVMRSVDLMQSGIFVEHGDIECRFAMPTQRRGVPSFVNYPWKTEKRKLDTAQIGGEYGVTDNVMDSSDVGISFGFLTNLDDADVVLGGTPKLQEMLDEVHNAYPNVPIHFNCTCPPIVIADEVNLVLQGFEEKHQAPVVFTTQDPGSPIGDFSKVLEVASAGAEFRPTDSKGVNLVGFTLGADHDDLAGLLEAIGIRLNVSIIPHNSADLLQRYADASVQVFFPNGPWMRLYSNAFGDLPQKSVHAGPPFGLNGTRTWLKNVASEFGLDAEVDPVVDARLEAMKGQWDALSQEARNHRLGFVLDRDDMERLNTPVRNMGIPIFNMLDEMGFGIDILCYTENDDDLGYSREILAGLPNGADKHTSVAFNEKEELWSLLENEKFEAVFSEYFYDWRLTQAGKAQFHMAHFEKGLAGALQSMERLVNICQLPFYRRYRRYLTRHV